MQMVFTRKDKDPLLQAAETARALRLAAARDAMDRAWNQLGGARAPIGLPLHRQIKVEGSARDPFEHCAAFRGGVLTLSDDGRRATATEIEEVQLSCVGVEWLDGMERQRAPCGAMAVFGPASVSLDVASFPAWGPLPRPCPPGPAPAPVDGGRFTALDLPLLRAGRVQDYWVWVVVAGGDEAGAGDRAACAAEAAAQQLGAAILSAVGDAVGVTAEGLVQRHSFKQKVAQAVGGGAVAALSAAVPAQGEVLPAVCVRLHWNTLGDRPAAPRLRFDLGGAEGGVGWTHRIVVPDLTGEDRCALYLRATTTIAARVVSVAIPAR
jgi:hypothetical protein